MTRVWLAIFFLGSLTMSGVWALGPRIGTIYYIVVPLLLLLIDRWGGDERPPVTPSSSVNRSKFVHMLGSGFFTMAPVLLYLVMTWRQEFPFVGDHDFHLGSSIDAFAFWKHRFIPAVFLLIGMITGRRWFNIYIQLFVFALISLVALVPHENLVFATRYPGGFYFLQIPLQALAGWFDWESPLNALRLTNALALPVWLWILRPKLLGKWPDVWLMAFSLLFLYQKETVYYFTASYLEPWALILCLLAVEHLFIHVERYAWRPFALIGLAAIFKEQSIFLLPFAAIATWPKRPDRRTLSTYAVALLTAATPFILYYLYRRQSVAQTFIPAAASEALGSGHLGAFLQRIQIQFEGMLPGVVGLIFLAALVVLLNRNPRRMIVRMVFLAAVFQVLFFLFSKITFEWVAYPRFHLHALMLFSAIVFLLEYIPNRRIARRWLLAICLAGVVVNAPPLFNFFRLASGHDYERNHFEHPRSPIYFPIRTMIAQADRSGILNGVRSIQVTDWVSIVVPTYSIGILHTAYPDLSKRFSLDLKGVGDPTVCKCTRDDEASLALSVRFTGLLSDHSRKSEMQIAMLQCRQMLIDSCEYVEQIGLDVEPYGVLGVGRRKEY